MMSTSIKVVNHIINCPNRAIFSYKLNICDTEHLPFNTHGNEVRQRVFSHIIKTFPQNQLGKTGVHIIYK